MSRQRYSAKPWRPTASCSPPALSPTTSNKTIKGQTEQILAEIDRLLKRAGTDKTKVVSATIWVADIRTREAMNEAWTAWTGGMNLPGRACIEAKLANPRALVEIAVIAAK